MEIAPRWVQAVGVGIVIAAVVFWAITGRESALIVGAGLSLGGIGELGRLRVSFVSDEELPTPPPIAKGHDRRTNGRTPRAQN